MTIRYKNRAELKRIKYIEDKLIQCAVSGDIDQFIILSNKLDNVKYQKLIYYPLKHGKPEMIEYLLGKVGLIDPDYFMRCLMPRYSNRIGTDRLLKLINLIDDVNVNTERLFEFREHIVSHFLHECFNKFYTEKLIMGIDLIEPKEVREGILNDFIKDSQSKDTINGQKMKESLSILVRDRSLSNLLDI